MKNIWNYIKIFVQGTWFRVIGLVILVFGVIYLLWDDPDSQRKMINKAVDVKSNVEEKIKVNEDANVKSIKNDSGAVNYSQSKKKTENPIQELFKKEEREADPLPLNVISTSAENNISSDYAPFGRYIPCILFNAIDSSRAVTQITGIVIKDVWEEGKIIIPKGAEVHGTAQVDTQNARIYSQNQWVIVWRSRDENNAKELILNGIAVEYSPSPEKENSWMITDRTPGIPGEVITSDKLAVLKILAAKWLQGAGRALSGNKTTINGNTIESSNEGSLKNLIASGVQDSAETYAQMMLQKIQQEGFFIRVHAGSPFNVYVMQGIDLAKAQKGVAANGLQAKK